MTLSEHELPAKFELSSQASLLFMLIQCIALHFLCNFRYTLRTLLVYNKFVSRMSWLSDILRIYFNQLTLYEIFKVHIFWLKIYQSLENSKLLNPLIAHKSFLWSGSHLLSHTVSSIVSSAVWVLTIVFGMCTGVSPKRIATRNSLYFVKPLEVASQLLLYPRLLAQLLSSFP